MNLHKPGALPAEEAGAGGARVLVALAVPPGEPLAGAGARVLVV